MRMKKWFIGVGILAILLVAGYIAADILVRKKVAAAFGALPASLNVGYSALHVNLFTGSVVIDSLHGRGIAVNRVGAHGIGFLTFLRSHRLQLRSLVLEGCTAEPEEKSLPGDSLSRRMELPFTYLAIGVVECTGLKLTMRNRGISLEGTVTVDSVGGPADSLQSGGMRVGAMRADLDRFRYVIPDAEEIVVGRHLQLDSRKEILRLDTLRILPALDQEAIGRKLGHQVDVVATTSEGIMVEGLEVMELLQHRLTADKITIHSNHIHVFRDRRLPLVPGEKDLPVGSLKALPVTLRVGSVEIGPTFFAYEEYPAKGDQTGTMKIYRMSGRIAPLINHPVAGDPAYITVHTEGSLMNSGSVVATTKMPLHAGDPYLVEGAFHELDVTTLNDPAENLGKLHLESGMLNFLSFRFEMNTEKATGQIVGEYHDLVVDKLKDNGKEAKVKSFALKKFIIPRDKDKSLPEKKRTGKVDYKRDPQRYFSYYLLHSLLVGVKSSFSLGFLLPG